MKTTMAILTVRALLETAGKVVATRDGISPAAAVQRVYDLPLVDVFSLLEADAKELMKALAQEDDRAIASAAESAQQQLGVGSGPEVASTAPGPGEAALVKDWKAGDEAAYKAAASPTAETAQAAPAAEVAPAPEPAAETAKPKE